jgi:hypothetical protein
MAHSAVEHDDLVLVRSGSDIGIPKRASGLHDMRYIAASCTVDIVSERNESVRRQTKRPPFAEPGFAVDRSQRMETGGQLVHEHLTLSSTQLIKPEEHIHQVHFFYAANLTRERRVGHFRML